MRYTLPFLTQVWLFATPVAYPSSMVPAAWRSLYALNPMVGVVDGFRWALMDGAPPPTMTVGVSCLAVALLLAGGLVYFRRTERTFADVDLNAHRRKRSLASASRSSTLSDRLGAAAAACSSQVRLR